MNAFLIWWVCNEEEKENRRQAEAEGYEYEPFLSLGSFVDCWDSWWFRIVIISILIGAAGLYGWMFWSFAEAQAAYEAAMESIR